MRLLRLERAQPLGAKPRAPQRSCGRAQGARLSPKQGERPLPFKGEGADLCFRPAGSTVGVGWLSDSIHLTRESGKMNTFYPLLFSSQIFTISPYCSLAEPTAFDSSVSMCMAVA